jgi:hypothetical protein
MMAMFDPPGATNRDTVATDQESNLEPCQKWVWVNSGMAMRMEFKDEGHAVVAGARLGLSIDKIELAV